ncbi:hypothetical protein V1286_003737 [Bradyrhizobium algeriense]|uniref:Uncharacterized protein n=1 Tax=Bradyrhizobium algeriense TaxID=634784 RepID=A0ABU8BDZ5_9BRAD
MPLFNSQIHWQGMGNTVAVGLLTLFAVVSYVEWSSNAAVTEFISATEASASDPNQSNESPASIQSSRAERGCPQGKRPLPTELMPLP